MYNMPCNMQANVAYLMTAVQSSILTDGKADTIISYAFISKAVTVAKAAGLEASRLTYMQVLSVRLQFKRDIQVV